MDHLYLPVVKEKDTLISAISLMKKDQSPALIVTGKEGPVLFPSRAVFRSYGNFVELCGDLDRKLGQKVLDLTKSNIDEREIHGLTTQLTPIPKVGRQLEKNNLKFGLLPMNTKLRTALVITLFETYKAEIVGQNVICVCTGPDRHLVEGIPGLDGKGCNICAHSYECTLSI
ncbi:MAG TPA: hypothetical protein VHK91_14385 [Flavisolibacter sp.]|jgi:hypothetical protein|nr:hypothetical protein [Flavisolibacter sp.]